MKIYWLNSQIPELCQLSKRRRKVFIKAVTRHTMIHWVTWPIMFISGAVVGAASTLFLMLKWNMPFPVTILFSFVSGGMIGLIGEQWRIARLRPVVRKWLRSRSGKPFICFECGYPLRSIRGSTCPECGAQIVIAPRDRSRKGCLKRKNSITISQRKSP